MNKQITPLITIGLTTYNRPNFLQESVQSVINQKYKNFKLIIGNDYPESKVTFETLGIDYDSRIDIINFKENIGEVNNLNYLLNQAESDWFTWLADDDIFHESFLDSMIKSLENTTNNIIAVYSPYVSGKNPNDKFFNQNLSQNSMQLTAVDFISKYLLREFYIVGCYGLMNTKKLKKIGGFPSLGPSEGSYGDTIIPILLSEHGNINIIDNPLVYLRTHLESYSARIAPLNHYTSAEPDVLIKVSNVCQSLAPNSFKNKCIYLMVKWFAESEFAVIFRVQPGSKPLSFFHKFILLIKLLIYQLKVNYPRIKIRYWLSYTLHIIRLLFRFFFP